MPLVVYGAIGPVREERQLAYQLLAAALEREYGMDSVPEILREEGGKPYFPDFPDIAFNLSHSRGAAVCALSNAPVGVDVERIRTAPRRLAQGMEDEAFFRLWTALEATIKWKGLGIASLWKCREPDKRCQCLEGFLPGYIVTVCPAEEPVRRVRIESF